MRKHALALAALCGSLFGCGGDDDDGPRGVLEIVPGPGVPASYRLADPDCQATRPSTPLALHNTVVPAWDGDGLALKPATMQGIVSDDSLRSEAVSLTRYADKFQRICDFRKPEGRECDGANGKEQSWVGPDPQSPQGKLRVCKDGVAFDRDTYEGVGLTSTHYIERAYGRYQAIAGKTLPQIKLYVLPSFVDYYDNFVDQRDGRTKRLELTVTHNLAYFPGSPLVVVFPEKKEAVNPAGFLWESSFVLAHEFGHHIDFTAHGQLQEQIGLTWSPTRHGFIDLTSFASTGSAASERAQVAGAYAEAFADLLAFYAEGASSQALVGLKCFGKNRDVARETFAGGLDKILTDDRLGLLLGRGDEPRDADCTKPRFSDIHTGGAILAHTLDRAFKMLTAADATLSPDSEAEIAARYRLTLAFKDRLAEASTNLTSGTRGAALFAPFSTALAAVTDKHFTGLTLRDEPGTEPQAVRSELCRLVAERLPVVEPPFQLAGGCG